MYYLIAIIAFGALIAIHELGHFTAAKLLNVKVNEFAIGMGPKLIGRQGKETLYSLRALPFGGFCSMEGEYEGAEDPRSLNAQSRWKRAVIFLAGSVANFIAAFIIICIITSGMDSFVGTTLTGLADAFPNKGERGLMAGDTLVSINGDRLYYIDDFTMFMQFAKDGKVDLVVRRDGELVRLDGFPLERRPNMIEGDPEPRFGLYFNSIEATAAEQLKYSVYQSYYFVRLIRVSLAQLFSGDASLSDMSGPVGIVDTINTIGKDAAERFGIAAALRNIAFFLAFIGINLAVMNMLPIPALDGGRILSIIVTWFIEKIIRRRLDPKYEGYVHMAAMAVLLAFMAVLLISDVVKLVNG